MGYAPFQGSTSINTFPFTNIDFVAGIPSIVIPPAPPFCPQARPEAPSYQSQSSPSLIKDNPKECSQPTTLFWPQAQLGPFLSRSQTIPSPIMDDPKACTPSISQPVPPFWPRAQLDPFLSQSQTIPSPIMDDPKACTPSISQPVPSIWPRNQPDPILSQSQSIPSPIMDDPKARTPSIPQPVPSTWPRAQPDPFLSQSQSIPSPIMDDPKASTLSITPQPYISGFKADNGGSFKQALSSVMKMSTPPSIDSKRRMSTDSSLEITLKRAKQGAGKDSHADKQLIASTKCTNHDRTTIVKEPVSLPLALTQLSVPSLLRGLNEKISSVINIIEGGVFSIGREIPICKEDAEPFRDRAWYSWQTFNILRASMRSKPGWSIILPEERSIPTRDTTDIVWIMHEDHRMHWTTIHLSIHQWKMVYYDSYFHIGNPANKHKACAVALRDVRRYAGSGLQIPTQDPQIDARCSIDQRDSWSCGPLAWREIEMLIHGPSDDGKDPLAIRLHQLDLVYSKLLMEKDHMNHNSSVQLDESPTLQVDDGPVLMIDVACQENTSRISTNPEPSTIGASISRFFPGTVIPDSDSSKCSDEELPADGLNTSIDESPADGSNYSDDESPADGSNSSNDESRADRAKIDSELLQDKVNNTSGKPCSRVSDDLDTYKKPNLEAYPQPPLRSKGRRWTTEQTDYVVASRRAGKTCKTIAKELGGTAESIWYCTKRYRAQIESILDSSEGDSDDEASVRGII